MTPRDAPGDTGEAANEASRHAPATCESGAMAKFRSSMSRQNCGADHPALAGKMRIGAASGTRSSRKAPRSESAGAARRMRSAAGRPFSVEDLSGASQSEPRLVTGIAESSSGRRRRVRGRFSHADRRRAGHRQVDPVDPGLRGGRAGGGPGRLRFGRGIDRPGRLRAARLGLAEAPVQLRRNLRRGHRGDARPLGPHPDFRAIDSIQTMWSDAIELASGTVSQVRGSGAGLDPLRQGERRGSAAGWDVTRTANPPAARGRAYGRRGPLLRGRRRARLSPLAGGQEPVRRD